MCDLCGRVAGAFDHDEQENVDDALLLVGTQVAERQRQHVQQLARVKRQQRAQVRVRLAAVVSVARPRRMHGRHTRQHRVLDRLHAIGGDVTRPRVNTPGQTTADVDQQLVTQLSLQTDRQTRQGNTPHTHMLSNANGH